MQAMPLCPTTNHRCAFGSRTSTKFSHATTVTSRARMVCRAHIAGQTNGESRNWVMKAAGATARVAAIGLATAAILASPAPSWADVQMVAPSQAIQMAKPFQKQEIDKGKVWAVLAGGAVVLFGATLVFENNEKYFPAITRANKAMKISKKQAEFEEKREAAMMAEQQAVQRQTAMVEEGLAQARARALASASASSSAPKAQAPSEGSRAAAAVSNGAPEQQAVDEGTQERLASFVQGVAGGGKQALEALKAQQKSGAGSGSKGA